MALRRDVAYELQGLSLVLGKGLRALSPKELQYVRKYEDEIRGGELKNKSAQKRLTKALEQADYGEPSEKKELPSSALSSWMRGEWWGSSKKGSKGFDKAATDFPPPVRWVSSGGVVVPSYHPDEMGYVYIRKPTGGFGGKQWTLPKGRVDKGEDQKQTAVREVAEETGIRAQIVPGGYLGKYRGDMSDTHYYLMVQTGGVASAMDKETEEVRLVPLETAVKMFKSAGNSRDAKVLEKAREILQVLQEKYKGKKFTRRMAFSRVKLSAEDYAKERGIEISDYVDATTKKRDPSKVVVRLPKYQSKLVLDMFLDALRIRPEFETTGQKYHLAVLDAAAFARARVTHETASVGKRWK